MKFDWGKLILFILALFLLQQVLAWVLIQLGLNGLGFYLIFDGIISFALTYYYIPSYARKGIFRSPDFYKNWGIFYLILLVLDFIL